MAISVKDFRSIIAHAVTLATSVSALYSVPAQPLQLSYSKEGMRCEFTLMTIGDYQGTTPVVTRAATRGPRETSANSHPEPRRSVRPDTNDQPQGEARKEGKLGSRKTALAAQPENTRDESGSDSLFVPAAEDEDQRWEPADIRQDEEAMLGWDASASIVRFLASAPNDLVLTEIRTLDFVQLSQTAAPEVKATFHFPLQRPLHLRSVLLKYAACLTDLELDALPLACVSRNALNQGSTEQPMS